MGDESTELVADTETKSPARETRRALEAFHGKVDPAAIEAAWPHLANGDRFIRWAARTAVEHQPMNTWADKALGESDPSKQINALLALARVAGVCPQHRDDKTPPVDIAMRGKLLAAVNAIDAKSLSEVDLLTLVRTTQIILNRFWDTG